MRFGVLGPLRVVDGGGGAVLLPRAKERRLLAVLLVHVDRTVAPERLADAVWPGEDRPVRPARALQTIVSRLRSSLGEGTIASEPAGYRLAVAPAAVDAHTFERLFAEGRRTLERDPAVALAALDEALGLWRGGAYEEFAQDPFAQAEAVRLDGLRVAAVECRIDARLALGGHVDLVGELQALVAQHPFSERLREQLMVALYRSGRQADALAAFQSYRRLLADELGLEPSPALRELEWRVLTHGVEGRPPSPLSDRPPPAQSWRRLDNELGLSATRLIGREHETTRVLDALAEARLVTLTGPGGVGKSRLAAHVARLAGDRFRCEVAACALAPIGDPEAVPSALATALGVRRRQDRGIEESIVDAVGQRGLLLVLDNCEHVVDIAAPVVAFLVSRCPRLTVLATSRGRLGLTAERVIDVAPLSLPDRGRVGSTTGTAVELFWDRASSLGVELATDEPTSQLVAGICRRLDGLPLAVELAAAQVRTVHLPDIAERLAESPAPVHSWFRDVPDRHKSLSTVAGWSYQLLDEAERNVFDGLSVFAGSFDIDAVVRVSAAAGISETNVADRLARLVDNSMVVLQPGTGPSRYRLLETLRGYGRQQLARRGYLSCWRQAHARHYLGVAEEAERGLAGPGEAAWCVRLDEELDNLREARRWGLEHDADLALRLVGALVHFRWRTLHAEIERWAEETAEHAPDHRLAPLLLGSAALGAWSRGEFDRARRLGRSAAAATGGPDPALRVAVEALAAVCLLEGDLDEAERLFAEAISLARGGGDRFHEAAVLCSRAITLGYLGRPAEADNEVAQAEAIGRELRCPSLLAWALYARAERLVESDPGRALGLLDRSEALARRVGNHFVRAVAGISGTTIRARVGAPSSALPRFKELIEHLEGLGNRTQLWTMVRSLIQVLVEAGEQEAAAVLHGALEASATAVAPFGPDHERLLRAAAAVTDHAGADAVEAWKRRGREMGDQEAMAYALSAIDRALAEVQ